ncbi:hypothetical protein DFJ73DRAFT_767298 [Zopfochytrium polystomum]|nr:hypothetical protein DFJ73DRAFT_767298 [Zopfochytrium polystomum]
MPEVISLPSSAVVGGGRAGCGVRASTAEDRGGGSGRQFGWSRCGTKALQESSSAHIAVQCELNEPGAQQPEVLFRRQALPEHDAADPADWEVSDPSDRTGTPANSPKPCNSLVTSTCEGINVETARAMITKVGFATVGFIEAAEGSEAMHRALRSRGELESLRIDDVEPPDSIRAPTTIPPRRGGCRCGRPWLPQTQRPLTPPPSLRTRA